jgi:hypothetical protein
MGDEAGKESGDLDVPISRGLTIGRIPGKTYKIFSNLAREDFCGDYGMLLHQLMNDREELIKLKKWLFEQKVVIINDKKNL